MIRCSTIGVSIINANKQRVKLSALHVLNIKNITIHPNDKSVLVF